MPPREFSPDFGEVIRRERERLGFTLGDVCELVGMSITYLSKVERGEFPPPTESKIIALAKVLRLSADELLRLAQRVPSDLLTIIRRHPAEYAAILRATRRMNRRQLLALLQFIRSGGPDDPTMMAYAG